MGYLSGGVKTSERSGRMKGMKEATSANSWGYTETGLGCACAGVNEMVRTCMQISKTNVYFWMLIQFCFIGSCLFKIQPEVTALHDPPPFS